MFSHNGSWVFYWLYFEFFFLKHFRDKKLEFWYQWKTNIFSRPFENMFFLLQENSTKNMNKKILVLRTDKEKVFFLFKKL